MAALRAVVRAISVAARVRPRVTAAVSAASITRPSRVVRRPVSLNSHRWASPVRGHRGFSITATRASAADARNAQIDITDPHSFEVRRADNP